MSQVSYKNGVAGRFSKRGVWTPENQEAAPKTAGKAQALDLAAFEGHTPGPWVCFYVGVAADPSAFSTRGAAEACALFAAQETASNVETSVMPLALAEAAPALLALAREQQEEIARLREALEGAVTQMAQDNPSAGSRDYEQALPYTLAKCRAALGPKS